MPDPIHAPYLANVGYVIADTPRSAVYLGGGRVLTAYHAYRGRASNQVWLEGRPFDFDAKRTGRMRNPSWTGLGQESDLVVIHLREKPNLPTLHLADRKPFGGERVILAGYGSVRDGARTEWDGLQGFRIKPFSLPVDRLATWGENVVEAVGISCRTLSGDGDTIAFATVFNDEDALALEAQASGGDSGGAVFVERGSGWELVGIIEAAGPGNLAEQGWTEEKVPFGSATYATDLTVYREQILAPAAVPEPGVATLLACASAGLILRRRRAA